MTRYLSKLLGITVAIITMGAQIVCGCPELAAVKQVPPPATRECVGERGCCHKAELQRESLPQKQEPCDKCNLKHRTQQAMPDRQSSSMPGLTLCAVPVSFQVISVSDCSTPVRLADGIPSPPLLQDLFHVHSLLLN